ncbi:hypothetical protein [Effusibacillus dendaii]|uniref:Uncharacterized protein n=1 Tax=Effusibacillus dendaii TaxID=2743772 RepID=A0A7I8D6S6_9BACL|nr:hypothetical protein [Effusibacillus dendaii]BCJ85838.1 hypothetical protein skT53_08230 [Effusibacillus dendaii]
MNLFVKPLSGNDQFEEFGIFLEQGQIGNLFVYYDRSLAKVEGSAYLSDEQSKERFLHACSEELVPELLDRGIQEIQSMGLTIYHNQNAFQEELPSPAFHYGHPNSW